MDPKIAEAIGLLRHQIISPVLMDTGPAQMAYFRQMSEREFDVPGRGAKRFTATTMKAWLYRYRKQGFMGITPKIRKDLGHFRNITPTMKAQLKELRQENLGLSCVKFYDLCLKHSILGDPPMCMQTLSRFLKSENLYRTRTTQPRKRFEMSYFGELWTCDFMHGPQIIDADATRRRKKAILLAIIDDHTRMIVGARFGFFENTKLIEWVFKDAILAHGLPDRLYCDNGASFSSHYLSRVCAHLNIGLVHSKPYDSPSRGKIERFFRHVRESFLVDIREDQTWDIKSLNEAFDRWLREHYHHGHHRGIDSRPVDRYQISVRQYPRKRIAEETLDEFFLVTVQRVVNKDCTVSMHGIYYEVPPQFIGKRVELKFAQDHPTEVFLYDNGIRITRVQPVDSILNGRSYYQPSPRISDVALHELSTRGEK
jgi:transposase InsO family protein